MADNGANGPASEREVKISCRNIWKVYGPECDSYFDNRNGAVEEPAALRDRYGRHLFGQSVLMGRRMIETGCRFVTVIWDAPDGYSWDSHQHSNDVRDHLLPKFDQSFSALLDGRAEIGMSSRRIRNSRSKPMALNGWTIWSRLVTAWRGRPRDAGYGNGLSVMVGEPGRGGHRIWPGAA